MSRKNNLMPTKIITPRNEGLDIVRSIAIILVLLCHGFTFLFGPELLNKNLWFLLPLSGYYGVDLFFVLSGFLIGKILIKELIINSTRHKVSKTFKFYLRRWLRTLPLYYLILLLNIPFAIYYTRLFKYFSWKHFLFLQNFQESTIPFFAESWSLVVEEWFYLLFPIFIIILIKFKKTFSHKDFFKLLLFIILLLPIVRLICVSANPNLNFDFAMKKNPFLRLDTLSMGVLLAYLNIFRKGLFLFISRIAFLLFSIFILLFITIYCSTKSFTGFDVNATEPLFAWAMNLRGLGFSVFAKTFMISLISLSFVFIIAFFNSLNLKSSLFFSTISKISYSMYLTHLPILLVFSHFAPHKRWLTSVFLYILALIIIFVFSYILYRFYEKPIMNLRDRIKIRNIGLDIKS